MDLDIDGGDSLGLKIVRAMAGQLNGEFSITRGSPGAVCRLSYPVLD
jgi:two-component sensor histidine kinase